MTRTTEGAVPTPERTPSQRILKVLPCPTHTIGHPAIVVTQLSPMSPPFTPTRHQNQLDFTHSSHSPELGGDRQETVQDRLRSRKKAFDEAFEPKLWSLVPSTFRSQFGNECSAPAFSEQEQRPTVSDVIDRSDSLQHTPKGKQQSSSSQLEGGLGESPAETVSPGSPDRKRRRSSPTVSKSTRRRSRSSQQQVEDFCVSLPLASTTDARNRNPFEVHDEQESSHLAQGDGAKRSHHPHAEFNFLHRSQQIPKAIWRSVPTTPPALRRRRQSLEEDISPDHSPIRRGASLSSVRYTRRLDHIEWGVRQEDESIGGRVLIPESPMERLSRNDAPRFSPSGRISQSMSPGSTTEEYPDGILETPSKGKECAPADQISKDDSSLGIGTVLMTPTKPSNRRASMSSVSTKSPPSASGATYHLAFRRHSFVEPESPSTRTPKRLARQIRAQSSPSGASVSTEVVSSLLDSPTGGLQWSQSLETPIKNRAGSGSGAPIKTPTSNVIQRLRGMQPMRFMDEPGSVVEGWSASLETPPRKIALHTPSAPETKISKGVLDKLRGMPHFSSPQESRHRSASSPDGSFYSASSSLVGDDDDCQRRYEESGGCNGADSTRTSATVMNADVKMGTPSLSRTHSVSTIEFNPKLEDTSFEMPSVSGSTAIGITLPSSLVHELEQDSPDRTSPEYQSQIFPDSQDDIFGGLSNSAIDKGLLSRSNESMHHIPRSQLERLSGMDIDSQPIVSAEVDDSMVSACSHLQDPSEIRPAREAVEAQISQDLNMEDIHLEPWVMSSPILGDQHFGTDIKHENEHGNGTRYSQDLIEVNSDDDFGNIRLSQLDDGFNVVPEATQRSRRSQILVKIEESDHHVVDHAWLSMSASMLGDMSEMNGPRDFAQDVHQPAPKVFADGGFSSAGGKKLGPSKAALAKFASMFEDDGSIAGSSDEIKSALSAPGMPPTIGTPVAFGGFETAGRKALPAISESAQQRAALLLLGDDAESEVTANSSFHDNAFGGFQTAGKKALSAISKSAQQRAALLLLGDDAESEVTANSSFHDNAFGGFQTAGKKALPAISESAQQRAALLLLGDDAESEVTANSSFHDNAFGGFQTAGKKALSAISKFAQKRTTFLPEDDDTNGEVTAGFLSHGAAFDGFQTAGRKALPTISRSAQQRAALLFEGDGTHLGGVADTSRNYSRPPAHENIGSHISQSLGGFTTGGGKKLGEVSKDVLDKWSKQFAGEDSSFSGTREIPKQPPPQTGSISTPRPMPPKSFVGFSSGAGKALQPVSKAAQVRALGVLELDEPSMVVPAVQQSPLKGGMVHNNSNTTGSRRLGVVGPTGGGIPVQQPAISSHMNNLKLKSLRASSAGMMRPLSKAKAPFKPPLAFKPPTIMSGAMVSTSTSNNASNNSSAGIIRGSSISPVKSEPAIKKQASRRLPLHPNARPNATEPSGSTSLQPVKMAFPPIHQSLFNLEAPRGRTSFRDTFGSPIQRSTEVLLELGVPEDAIHMTFLIAQTYKFGHWGLEEARRELIERGAVEGLLSGVWLANHYRLIVWKLACYVRSWPDQFHPAPAESTLPPSSWFSPAKVMDQLAYRYEREINCAERPALRKIVEGDEPAAMHMVLCIADICKEYSEEAKHDVWKALVSDGWYVLPAVLDPCLTRAVERKKLRVGSKVHVCRAKLDGAESGIAILELDGAGASSSAVSLVLQANCTRLARWDAKLGFQRSPVLWTTRLRNITPEGGIVPGLDVVVLRKYPVIFLETLEDGVTKVKRNAREEDLAMEAHSEAMQKRYQNIVQEVEREFGDVMETDPARMQEEIQARTGDLQKAVPARNVTPFFTIRVGNYEGGRGLDDYDDQEKGRQQEALVTFWSPDHEPYQEGHRVRITALLAKKLSHELGFEDMLQLTGTRMTSVREMPTDPETLLLTHYLPREITSCAEIGHLYHGAEMDIAVVILAVGEGVVQSNRIYMVVTDTSRQLVLVEHQLSTPFVSTSAAAAAADTTSKVSQASTRPQPALSSFLKVNNRILMANARYKMRDHKLGLDIVTSLQSYTHVIVAPSATAAAATRATTHSSVGTLTGLSRWPAYAQSSLIKLNEICMGVDNDGKRNSGNGGGSFSTSKRGQEQETLLELMAKANVILAGMRPSY